MTATRDGEFVTITNTASGGEYAGVTATVWLFVDDDDTRGITFTPAARTIREGATGTYDVKLNTAPTADVTVAISSDNPDVTVNKSSLTFTTVNYARNQRVTVTAGQDADAADGTANLTHRPSGGDYSAGEAKDFMVTVTDDDTAGLVLSATTLGVDEAGQNTYTVKLQTRAHRHCHRDRQLGRPGRGRGDLLPAQVHRVELGYGADGHRRGRR